MPKGYYTDKDEKGFFQGKLYTVKELQDRLIDIVHARDKERIVKEHQIYLERLYDTEQPLTSRDFLTDKMDGDAVKQMLAALVNYRLVVRFKVGRELCYLLSEQGVEALEKDDHAHIEKDLTLTKRK